jgi:hypothetical protein
LTFFGEGLAFSILETSMRRMPIEPGALDAVLPEHGLKFPAQGFIDLSGRPS